MNKLSKLATVPMMVTGMLMFVACSPTEKPAMNNAVSASLPSSAKPNPAATPAGSTKTTTPVKLEPEAANVKSDSPDTIAMIKQIKEMLELAKSGKVPGIGFAAHTGIRDNVEKLWGKADTKTSMGSLTYVTYAKKNAVFGFNKGSQIFDVRSNDPKLHDLTLDLIEQALGKPYDIKINGDDKIYIYRASDEFQLKFIIPKSTGNVDHISVYDSQDAFNNMAG